jgi:hypothetical protein
MKIQVIVLWVATLHSNMVRYQCFREPCCIHLQDEDGFGIEAATKM